jgi:hypothetical protein
LGEHHHYGREHGDDMPEVKAWKWTGRTSREEKERRKDID